MQPVCKLFSATTHYDYYYLLPRAAQTHMRHPSLFQVELATSAAAAVQHSLLGDSSREDCCCFDQGMPALLLLPLLEFVPQVER